MRRYAARAVRAGCLLVGLGLAAAGAAQDDYPSRPIRLLTPAAPGGTTDLLARIVGARLGEAFKQQIVVDNRASASGVLAGQLTAAAPADGHTLLLAYHQHTINAALNPQLPYHPVESFTPITQLTTAGTLLVVNRVTPVRSLQEFIQWTRSSSGRLNFGSAGVGTGGHLAGELYKLMTGVKAEHIPYKGSSPALLDLVAGRYDFSFAGLQGAQPLVRAEKLRAIAITTPRRVAALPDVPAMAEALPGFEVVGWYGVIGPAKLPQPVVAKLHAELIKALHHPEVRERIVADGAEPVGNSPEEFRQFMLTDLAKWARVVKESGAKLE
jgi:tripartite-type tricarboxylate transporter receptor subunit TctC